RRPADLEPARVNLGYGNKLDSVGEADDKNRRRAVANLGHDQCQPFSEVQKHRVVAPAVVRSRLDLYKANETTVSQCVEIQRAEPAEAMKLAVPCGLDGEPQSFLVRLIIVSGKKRCAIGVGTRGP